MKKMFIEDLITTDTLKSVRRQLTNFSDTELQVHFDSPGGSVLAGISVDSELKEFRRNNPNVYITAYVAGIAASMASFLVCSPVFNKIAVEDKGVFMLHNPFVGSQGDYRELKKTAEFLERMAGVLASQYAEKSKKPLSEIRDMMDSESWLFGAEIVEAGFANEVLKTETQEPMDKAAAVAQAQNKFSSIRGTVKQSAAASIQEMQQALESMKDGGSILGNTREGKVYTSDMVRTDPHRLFELVSLTPLGHEVINALTAAQTEQLKGPAGISENEYQQMVNADRQKAGLEPLYTGQQEPGPIDGVIKSEADFQAEIARDKLEMMGIKS